MNYTDIAIGMTGAQFVEVINGNNAITKEQIESLAADVLLRVIANNVKQIKAVDGKLQFTLDNENWIPVDNNVWGSITGDLSNQADLVSALNAKANQTSLDTTNANVTNLGGRLDNTNTNVTANTAAIANNATAIGALQTKQAKQVSSDDVVYLRIGASGYMQYSADGVTWETIQSLAEINWGAIGGDPSNQEDLMELFNSKLNVSRFTEHTSDVNNPHNVTKEQIGLGNVNNTSDTDKPISTAQQLVFDELALAIEELGAGKLDKTEEVEGIEYMTLTDWNAAKEAGDLSDKVIYIVD